ncbi:transposase IS511 [Mesorhizobium sp. L103C105A0]|nr:transposase IS511 [Mesorhizobium sp. L103C105A0]
MVGPAAKREAVAHLEAVMGLSERRACSFVGADRKMIRYQSRRPPETELRGRLRDLANERRRFGYRRLSILLRREGEASGVNRIYRLYREEGLTVRKRRARRRAVGTRAPILVEAKPNARWSLDFVHDQFACGRRFRVLNIVDDVTRECLADRPPRQARHDRIRPRRRVHLERHSRLGEGSSGGMALHRAGQADAERLVESFNGRMRDELLNESLFFGLDHAGSAVAEWRRTSTPPGHIPRSDTRPRQPMPRSSPQPAPTLR